ncbi:hypothetical protein Tco_0089009 [Tanacetum coccineum]
MYNQYDTTYDSQHNVGGSSSEHNVGGSSSQHNVDSSSSLVRPFSLDDKETTYPPQFRSSFMRTLLSKKSRHQRRRRTEVANRPRRRTRTEMPRNHGVFHGPLMKKLHCADLGVEVPGFVAQREDNKNKRYKSSVSSSFNMRDSRESNFNLNIMVGDEKDKVQEVRPSHPMSRDQAKRKGKGVTSSASSTTGLNVEVLARLMVNEYVVVNDLYNIQKGQNLTELLEIRMKELELKDRELRIREIDQRQKVEAIYLSTTDYELKRVIRARWKLTF